MTGLLVGTFVIAGIHTLLWLPRSLEWRRKIKKMQEEEADTEKKEPDDDTNEVEKDKV
jgi:hypothetical protein